MKKLILLSVSIVLALSAVSYAVDFKANLSIKTGDASLDLHLRDINNRASTATGADEVRSDLRTNFSLADREILFLSRKGYTLAEISYLALLAKQTGKKINDVAAIHSQGIGWGVLAKRLGVHPSDLNKLRVQQKKQEKAIVREWIKENAPKTPKYKMEKGFGPAGGGRGKGK
jgi:hypothetical protein